MSKLYDFLFFFIFFYFEHSKKRKNKASILRGNPAGLLAEVEEKLVSRGGRGKSWSRACGVQHVPKGVGDARVGGYG